MPSKTPHTNGNKPVENGINGTKDVEMKDDAPNPLKGGKGKKVKEGEEEMTVVVPPSKGSKLSAPPKKDTDGDVAMDGEVEGEDDSAVKVDPVTQAISGTLTASWPLHFCPVFANITPFLQISRVTSHYLSALLPCSMPDLPSEPSGRFPQSANALHPISSHKLSPRPILQPVLRQDRC